MGLDIAVEHYSAAARALAASEAPLADRLQTVWNEHVQMVWMQPCLTADLLREHRALWERYTAPSDDSHSTLLRTLTAQEAARAIDEVLTLAFAVAAAARAGDDDPLATIADLD